MVRWGRPFVQGVGVCAMRCLISAGLVERVSVADTGKKYITIRDMSDGGAVELSAGVETDVSGLVENSVIRFEGTLQAYGYSIEGTTRRGFGLRLVSGKVTPIAASIDDLIGARK